MVRGVYHKKMMDYGFDIINILVGFDEAESQMQVSYNDKNLALSKFCVPVCNCDTLLSSLQLA